ncbi:MAG TPA: hypothetical protein VKB41_08310 [Steroidobacteraceae bacterium]|nr:hypothetical protein [Steroidobacteraceae bacterium]
MSQVVPAEVREPGTLARFAEGARVERAGDLLSSVREHIATFPRQGLQERHDRRGERHAVRALALVVRARYPRVPAREVDARPLQVAHVRHARTLQEREERGRPGVRRDFLQQPLDVEPGRRLDFVLLDVRHRDEGRVRQPFPLHAGTRHLAEDRHDPVPARRPLCPLDAGTRRSRHVGIDRRHRDRIQAREERELRVRVEGRHPASRFNLVTASRHVWTDSPSWTCRQIRSRRAVSYSSALSRSAVKQERRIGAPRIWNRHHQGPPGVLL